MSNKVLSDEEFLQQFKALGASGLAKKTGMDLRNIYRRRRNLERFTGEVINSPNDPSSQRFVTYEKRIPLDVKDGIVLIGSDAHFWPNRRSIAYRAMLSLSEEFGDDLKAIVLNGDVKDGATNGRHPPIGWERKPSLNEELNEIEDRLAEIEAHAPNAKYFWMLGNHDMRFENKLAANVPEYQGVRGFYLKDHFPGWTIGMSLWVNDTVVIKHRFKGGIHATHNNTLWAGKSMVTGHLHSLKVTPFTDYNGTRFGVDTGTMEDPCGPQFDYDEDNPKNHRSGLIVLSFREGKLLWPEIARVVGPRHIDFRGRMIEV